MTSQSTDAGWHALFPVETVLAEETRTFGGLIAAHVTPGTVVALYGTLGAGKTQFVKGFCAACGIPAETVNSPTFTLINEYKGEAWPIFHMDAYRIERVEEFINLGVEEYFYGGGICLVEWPERIEPLLPRHTLRLLLRHLDTGGRRIERL